FSDVGTLALLCQLGSGKKSLTPPPVAPPVAPSFHTTSFVMLFPDASSRVPPHARAYGLEAGKSTCATDPSTPPFDPPPPAAQPTVTPMAAAAWKAWSYACIDCGVHDDSGPPQLIEMTEGL